MKKKVVWLVVTGWMVAALLLASCAPAAVKEEEKVAPPVREKEAVVPKEVVVPKKEANLVKWTGKKRDGTVVEKMLEKPKYGGVYIAGRESQPNVFDSIRDASAWAAEPVVERLFIQDWTRGPAGTGETQTVILSIVRIGLETGVLATSWELRDAETLVYHIRQGVHWQNKPPMNGRQFTADDVVFDYIRLFRPGTYGAGRGALLSDPANPENSIYDVVY